MSTERSKLILRAVASCGYIKARTMYGEAALHEAVDQKFLHCRLPVARPVRLLWDI